MTFSFLYFIVSFSKEEISKQTMTSASMFINNFKNPALEMIANVLQGEGTSLPNGMGPGEVANLKFCPTASADVERSFSQYKNILSDKRQRFTHSTLGFTKENLSKVVVTHCYYNRHCME